MTSISGSGLGSFSPKGDFAVSTLVQIARRILHDQKVTRLDFDFRRHVFLIRCTATCSGSDSVASTARCRCPRSLG
jgi:hypothetical protein